MATIKHPYYDGSWTMSQMWDFNTYPHMEAIVRYIEPKIIRGIYLPCWIWGGKHQFFNKGTAYEYSYPVVGIPTNLIHPKKGTRKTVYVHRFMAQTFWHMKDSEIVYRVCGKTNCINPKHFRISYRNDPEYHR